MYNKKISLFMSIFLLILTGISLVTAHYLFSYFLEHLPIIIETYFK